VSTQIAFVLYDDMTALDIVGPYEVLARLPGADARFVATTPGPKRTDAGLTLVADHALDDVPAPDIVVVPGAPGPGTVGAMNDATLLDWLRKAHDTARWTTSVCTGALVLASAGLLEGKRATTHWLVRDALRQFGAEPVPDRVVIEGDVITAAGVSSGIDMALTLAAREAGEADARALQLVIEYDPEPPFDTGAPEKADEATRRRATEILLPASAEA
jgi:transcriptional regulator GlxA family with amidase domain